VVDWGGGVLASCSRGSNCPLARAMDGRICAAAPVNLGSRSCRSTATSEMVKCGLTGCLPCE